MIKRINTNTKSFDFTRTLAQSIALDLVGGAEMTANAVVGSFNFALEKRRL